MKYLEELSHGDTFLLEENVFILTSDYKSTNKKLCYSMLTGFPRWLDDKTVVELCPVYTLDKDNNVVAVKPTPKND